MKHYLLLAFFAFTAVNLSAQALADSSFEASGPGGNPWTSTSTNFGTSLCDAASCGNCGGPCVPNSGSWYVWFGGTSSIETGTVAQTFNSATAGTGSLTYYWMVPMKGAAGDTLDILIDGVSKSKVNTNDSIGAYEKVTLNVGAITAGTHLITFSFQKQASATAVNVLVDDIQLRIAGTASVEEIDFTNGIQISSNAETKKVLVKYNLTQSQNLRLTATDISGKTVYSEQFDNQQADQQTIESGGWASGIYNITLSTDSGLTKTTKVVVY